MKANATLEEQLAAAKPGDAICYAFGVSIKTCPKEMKKAAREALKAYYAGRVELVQRRLTGPFDDPSRLGTFAYLAIKRDIIRVPYVNPNVVIARDVEP